MKRAARLIVAGAGAGLAACGLSVVGVAPEASDTTDADVAAVDSGIDAPEASAATFCERQAPKPTFCADFDTPGDPGWQPFPLDAGTSVDLSKRYLLAVSTNEDSAARRTTAPCPNGFSLELDVRFDRVPSGTSRISPILVTPPKFPGNDLYFFDSKDVSYFQEYRDELSPTTGAPALHEWHHLSLDVTISAEATVATAKLDDHVYWNAKKLLYPIAHDQTTLTFDFGVARNYESAEGGEIAVDNIVLRAR